MTEDEAREAALQRIARYFEVTPADRTYFEAGWDAARQYDEQRIAALVAALTECAIVLEALNAAGGTGVSGEIATAVTVARAALGIGRALADQTEEPRETPDTPAPPAG